MAVQPNILLGHQRPPLLLLSPPLLLSLPLLLLSPLPSPFVLQEQQRQVEDPSREVKKVSRQLNRFIQFRFFWDSTILETAIKFVHK